MKKPRQIFATRFFGQKLGSGRECTAFWLSGDIRYIRYKSRKMQPAQGGHILVKNVVVFLYIIPYLMNIFPYNHLSRSQSNAPRRRVIIDCVLRGQERGLCRED